MVVFNEHPSGSSHMYGNANTPCSSPVALAGGDRTLRRGTMVANIFRELVSRRSVVGPRPLRGAYKDAFRYGYPSRPARQIRWGTPGLFYIHLNG